MSLCRTELPLLPACSSSLGKPPLLHVDTPDDAAAWAAAHCGTLRAAIAEYGAVLIRGLGLRDAREIEAVFQRLGILVGEREPFTVRRKYSERLYSSSRWPANQPMCMHHELSYALEFPTLMLFACLAAPTSAGATLVADSRPVMEALPKELVARFESVGWLLIRNYNDEIGAPIEAAFGTDDRHKVESYCRANAIKLEWRANGGLRTWQRRSAIIRHPHSGERCWFNQIAFLSEWTMDQELRDYLMDTYGADGLPFRTCFGNGERIGPDIVRLINEAYDANTVSEPWQRGDLLAVDNVRTAHGRERCGGPREVLVAMADAVHLARCSPTIDV